MALTATELVMAKPVSLGLMEYYLIGHLGLWQVRLFDY